jgi:hypothetical protein
LPLSLMLSHKASQMISHPHLLPGVAVTLLHGETHQMPKPRGVNVMHTLAALCMVSSTCRVKQTLACQAAGAVTATGQGGQRGGRQRGHMQSLRDGEPAQPTHNPAAHAPAPYLPSRTSDHQDCVPPRSWRHAGESREQETGSNMY